MSQTKSLTHYETLEVKFDATPDEIKQAFRRLAKQFHPDRNPSPSSQQKFQAVNHAYEILSDPNQRRVYNQTLHYRPSEAFGKQGDRTSRTETAQRQYRKARQQEPQREETLDEWLKRVYTPINKILNSIIKPLRAQIKALSADPFDDDLMDVFNTYIEESQDGIERAQGILRKMPNPPIAAAVSANLYYCINQLNDALQELEFFTQTYEESYLHDGTEMYRIAEGLRQEAMAAVCHLK
jgi:molecular chaperone DnaJ